LPEQRQSNRSVLQAARKTKTEALFLLLADFAFSSQDNDN